MLPTWIDEEINRPDDIKFEMINLLFVGMKRKFSLLANIQRSHSSFHSATVFVFIYINLYSSTSAHATASLFYEVLCESIKSLLFPLSLSHFELVYFRLILVIRLWNQKLDLDKIYVNVFTELVISRCFFSLAIQKIPMQNSLNLEHATKYNNNLFKVCESHERRHFSRKP